MVAHRGGEGRAHTSRNVFFSEPHSALVSKRFAFSVAVGQCTLFRFVLSFSSFFSSFSKLALQAIVVVELANCEEVLQVCHEGSPSFLPHTKYVLHAKAVVRVRTESCSEVSVHKVIKTRFGTSFTHLSFLAFTLWR